MSNNQITKMKKHITLIVFIFLNALSLYGQSYKVNIFENGAKVELDIWTYGAWRHTDSTHIKAEISQLNSIYKFKINSIESNQILLWSEDEIQKATFPFLISKSNKIIIPNQDEYDQMMNDLKEDVKETLDLFDFDPNESDGLLHFLYSPGVMYEAYHQPYIEILKHFMTKEIMTEEFETWEPNFSDSIPARMIVTSSVKNDTLLLHHKLTQDSITVCDYLYRKGVKKWKDEGRDTLWYASEFKNYDCPYMHTDYEFTSFLYKSGDVFSPSRIKFIRREPVGLRIEIEVVK